MGRNDQEIQFLEGLYNQLVGLTVEKVEIKEDDSSGFPEVWASIFFKKDDLRLKTEVSRDQEGNGPGFLFIGPVDENDQPIEQ